jgi:hypothetical protein
MTAPRTSSKIPTCLLLFICFCTAFAKTGQQPHKAPGVSVTGCLQNSRILDRYDLIGKDGKAYSLRSTSVKLSEHVGHTVSIKGQAKHDEKRDDYDFEGSEVNEGNGKKTATPLDVEVTSLKMLSASCR